MKDGKFMLTAIALAVTGFAGSAHAQATPEQMREALQQAQQAAERAQAAAAAAQAALAQIQAQAQAQAQGQAETQARAAATARTPGEGLTYSSGANSVTLYGLIDVTLTHVNHANAAGDSRFSYHPTPWFSGSRWGMAGSHALGEGGLKAIFRLESEFVSNTGEQDTAGVLFNRDAWVGLESDSLGKLTFGRQNALGRDFAANYMDPYGSARSSTNEGGGTNTNNFKQIIFYAGSATGTRIDRGLVWKKDFHNGLVAGLAYQFGGVAGAFNTGSTKAAALGYGAGPLNVAGFVQTANIAGLKHSSASIGGNYTFGVVRVNAGYFHYTADQGASGIAGQRKDNAWTVSTSIAPAGSKIDYQVGYQVMSANHAGITGTGATANVQNAYSDTSGIAATATGKRKTLYVSSFYHFDKQTDVYAVADFLSMDGGYRQKASNGYLKQTEYGVGMRFKF